MIIIHRHLLGVAAFLRASFQRVVLRKGKSHRRCFVELKTAHSIGSLPIVGDFLWDLWWFNGI